MPCDRCGKQTIINELKTGVKVRKCKVCGFQYLINN